MLGTKTPKEMKFMNGSTPSLPHLENWEETPHVPSHTTLKKIFSSEMALNSEGIKNRCINKPDIWVLRWQLSALC